MAMISKPRIIKQSYFSKALHDRKIEEISEEYSGRGYKVERNIKIQGFEFDLLATSKKRTIAFEVKLLPLSRLALNIIEKMKKIAVSKDFEFRLIVISKPEEKVISIDWLDKVFQDYFEKNELSRLDFLPEIPIIKKLHCEIQSLNIVDSIALAKLNGALDIEFSVEDCDEDGHSHCIDISDTIPFFGELEIHIPQKRIVKSTIEIDPVHWICKH